MLRLGTLFLLVALAGSTAYLFNENELLKGKALALRSKINTLQSQKRETDAVVQHAFKQTARSTEASPAERSGPSAQPDCVKPVERDYATKTEQLQVNRAVNEKYQLLLGSLNLAREERESVVSLLAERERLLNVSTHGYFTDPVESEITVLELEQKLEEIDREIAQVLDSEEAKTYETLKNSEFEQYQIKEFDQSLPPGEFLSKEQSKAILLAKLDYKSEYQNAIFHAAKLVESGQQNEGFSAFEQAIKSYKTSYLDKARNELTEQQFAQLEQYEETNFEDMLSSLTAAYEESEDE